MHRCGLCAEACKKEYHVPEGPYFRTWIERYIIKKPKPGSLETRGEVLVDSPEGGIIATAGTAQVTVFASGTGTSNAQTFTINNAQGPTITSLSPTAVNARGAAFTLTINGTGFTTSSVIRWNGIDRAGTYLSSTRLRTTVSAADIAVATAVKLTVFNPGASGGISNAQILTVQDPPAPTNSGLNPLLATAGGPAFTMTLSGSNFVTDSVVRWNGADRPTTFVSGTKLTAAIPAFGNSHGFVGGYPSTSHSVSCVVLGQNDGDMQRDYWYTAARDWRALEDGSASREPAFTPRRAGRRPAVGPRPPPGGSFWRRPNCPG